MGALKSFAVHAAAAAFNGLYRLLCLCGRRDEVLFVSRKANEPSYDYTECGTAFEGYGLIPVYLAQKLGARTVLPYAWLALREIYHLARCRVCVVDRYDPVVSLIDFECEPASGSHDKEDAIHCDFPAKPIVIQLWHAFGAFKKFGYQALDVAEGHSAQEAALFKIHRNYSWVICSGEGARKAFSEAFACPVERVIPLSRPTQQRLRELAGMRQGKRVNPVVLFAPTVRKYDKTSHPVQDLMERAGELFSSEPYEVRWALHPLESGKEASGGVPEYLLQADYVVTDYSSIVYEAYLLGERVVFFVPDIDHYRVSPGLNVDPTEVCPGLCAHDESELLGKLNAWTRDSGSYPESELRAFVDGAFEGSGSDPAEDLARFVVGKLTEYGEAR